MTSAITGTLAQLEHRRDALIADLELRMSNAMRAGRTFMSEDEARDNAELNDIKARIAHEREELRRAGDLSRLSSNSHQGQPMSTPAVSHPTDDHLIYNKRSAMQGRSWIADMARVATNSDYNGEARGRLARHAEEVRFDPAYSMEYRDISRTDGDGGYGVPPAWLVNQYVELARAGRPFANLCQRQPLPGGTDSINIPKLLTGTTVGIQSPDNSTVSETDLTDTFINAPVRTIAGQQGVALQLIDQSPIAFDDVVARDLVAANAAVVDQQVLYGSGTNGEVLGVDYTPGITTIAVGSVDIQGVYSAVANAIQTIHTTRFLPPEVIVMHPRRWGWMLAQLDSTNRPLVMPYGNAPFNAVGILEAVASQQVVGTMHGLPVVTDPNITTTAGAETPTGTEDVIYVLRASDLLLWESGLRCRVLPETRATTLTVLVQVYNYLAFCTRYPQSICTISGLTAPQW